MQYKIMTSEEIIISKIKNIKYIEINDLLNNEWNKHQAIAVLLIRYVDEDNHEKVLSYCEMDKVFEMYVKKVIQVYLEEKGRNEIVFGNEKTKLILENQAHIGKKMSYDNFFNKESTTKLLNYNSDTVKSVKNIIIYYIEFINKLLGNTITVEDNVYGNREVFSLKACLNNRSIYIPFSFKKTNNQVDIKINNILGSIDFINLSIKYNCEQIEISWEMPSSNLTYECVIDIRGYIKETLLSNGKEILYNNGLIKNEVKQDEIMMLNNIDDNSDCHFVKLPWNDFITCRKDIENYDSFVIESSSLKYITVTDNYASVEEYYEKLYKKYDDNIMISKMHLDAMHRIKELYLIDDYVVVSNTFYTMPLSLGKYREYFEGKTFYEFSQTDEKSLRLIKKIDLQDIDLKMIKHKSDLLNGKVFKLMIGRK